MALKTFFLRAVIASGAFCVCLAAGADEFRYLPSRVLSVEECAEVNASMTVVGDVRQGNTTRAYAWTKANGLEVVGDIGVESHATGVSENGNVVVGSFVTTQDETRAFVWTQARGAVDIGDLGGTYAVATDVSANGNMIVGSSEDADGFRQAFRASLNKAIEGDVQGLGTLGGDNSEALFVSADGRTVVGRSQVSNGDWHLFLWTAAEGMVDLGTLGGDRILVRDISDAAAVIVGAAENASGLLVPFVWTETTGMIRVPGVANVRGTVELVSDDGSALYGQAGFGGSVLNAFQLSLSNLSLMKLGSLFEQRVSLVSSASADGSVIGGQSVNQGGKLEAFLRAEESTPPGFLKQRRLLPLQRILRKVFGPQSIENLFFVDVPCISDDGHTLIVEATGEDGATLFLYVEIDDYPVIRGGGSGESYFESRPLNVEIAESVSVSLSNAGAMAEIYPSNEVVTYVALYADYASQYQQAAASLKVNGKNNAKVRDLYISYRYMALQLTYYAYAYTYYYVYLPSLGTAEYSSETLESLYDSYYYQNLDLEDLLDD